jgi:hypothetical protein
MGLGNPATCFNSLSKVGYFFGCSFGYVSNTNFSGPYSDDMLNYGYLFNNEFYPYQIQGGEVVVSSQNSTTCSVLSTAINQFLSCSIYTVPVLENFVSFVISDLANQTFDAMGFGPDTIAAI